MSEYRKFIRVLFRRTFLRGVIIVTLFFARAALQGLESLCVRKAILQTVGEAAPTAVDEYYAAHYNAMKGLHYARVRLRCTTILNQQSY